MQGNRENYEGEGPSNQSSSKTWARKRYANFAVQKLVSSKMYSAFYTAKFGGPEVKKKKKIPVNFIQKQFFPTFTEL